MLTRKQMLDASEVLTLIAKEYPVCAEQIANAKAVIYNYMIIPRCIRQCYYTDPETGIREYHEREDA